VILLDTNVLSETLKPAPSDRVLSWLAAQDPSAVFTTAITKAEILYGVEALPLGKRRSRLAAAIGNMFAEEFQGQVLPFDGDAAHAFAKIVSTHYMAGRPIAQLDAMIAAIAQSHNAAVATRNTADFEHCGVPIVNPWNG
jgi:predicted nucleic acid-binding protein